MLVGTAVVVAGAAAVVDATVLGVAAVEVWEAVGEVSCAAAVEGGTAVEVRGATVVDGGAEVV